MNDIERDEKEVLEKLNQWCNAVNTSDSGLIGLLYDEEAILLGTFSQKMCNSKNKIFDYFKSFFKLQDLKVKINESYIRTYQNFAIISGFYCFNYKKLSKIEEIKARYTFVLRKISDADWMIIEHHSSKLP